MTYKTPDEIERSIAGAFRRELECCDALTAAYIERCEPWTGKAADTPGARLLFLEIGRQTKTFRASVELARRGYGEQSAMLNRALFESMLIIRWMIDNPQSATDRFERAYRFEEHLKIERANNSGWLDDSERRSSDLSEEELSKLTNDFGKYNEKLWTGHADIRDLARGVRAHFDGDEWQLVENYIRFVHQENNQLLHSTVAGLSSGFVAVPEGFGVWTGPSEEKSHIVLFTAAWVYGQTLELSADYFELANPRGIEELTFEISQVFKQLPAGEEEPGRNDPCFCGSQEKYKNCHEDQVRRDRAAGTRPFDGDTGRA